MNALKYGRRAACDQRGVSNDRRLIHVVGVARTGKYVGALVPDVRNFQRSRAVQLPLHRGIPCIQSGQSLEGRPDVRLQVTCRPVQRQETVIGHRRENEGWRSSIQLERRDVVVCRIHIVIDSLSPAGWPRRAGSA